MSSIKSIGAYLPQLRLERSAIGQALGWLTTGTGRGLRTLAFWDEDSVTMAVAAARNLPAKDLQAIETLTLATTTPPFAEPQNAALTHAALRLPRYCCTQDATGTPRATLLALHAALENGRNALIVAADKPVAKAGSAAESRAGDAGAAVLAGAGDGLLNYLAGASLSAPFIHRSRATGATFPLDWEDRWIREEGYLKLLPEAIKTALERAGLAPDAINHLILPCAMAGAAASVVRAAGLTNARPAPDLNDQVGDTGTAHALLMLCAVAPQIAPGETVVLAQFGQGATALVFAAGEGLQQLGGLKEQIDGGRVETCYAKLLAFSDQLDWDRGLRGRYIVPESQSTAYRNAEAIFGFVASRDPHTGQVIFPPTAGGGLEPWPLADRGGTVATMTSDLLAFSRHPPNCYGLVDFNGGGRLMMDFTDPDAPDLAPGDPVRFVFRVKDIDAHSGYRRYFWKAVRDAAPA
ncbi:MAG: OB-fold domain-containing protein [Pararhodobacter sp.]|nr:OB-fold domain-containing protein [Pararhodobacter sp.]